jgi:hypothetical protein
MTIEELQTKFPNWTWTKTDPDTTPTYFHGSKPSPAPMRSMENAWVDRTGDTWVVARNSGSDFELRFWNGE